MARQVKAPATGADPFGRPLGTAPGEAYGPKVYHRRACWRWLEDAAAVVAAVGMVLYLAWYMLIYSIGG